MKRLAISHCDLVIGPELVRTKSSVLFQERLRASIEQIGLAEPIKVAPLPTGKYLVIDGVMRLKAIDAIRAARPESFDLIPAYVFDYEQRFEIRYQSDIYQDLLPSQLANLVEHLHKSERVRKSEIARYIGVSPPTVRNYTGLARLLERGGLFAKLVELMDAGVLPSSNPYAWLRLNADGVRFVLQRSFSSGDAAESWIKDQLVLARQGLAVRFPLKFIESATSGLPPAYYREREQIRSQKRDLGMRRSSSVNASFDAKASKALRHLNSIIRSSPDPLVRDAARSLMCYLK